MPASIVYNYEGRQVKAPIPTPPRVDVAIAQGAAQLGIPKDSFDLYDRYGKIEMAEDLQRAIHMAGTGDCHVEVREHEHYRRLRGVEGRHDHVDERLESLEAFVNGIQGSIDRCVMSASDQLKDMFAKLQYKVDHEVVKHIQELFSHKNQLQRDVRIIEEKLSQVDITELKAVAAATTTLRDEVQDAVQKVNALSQSWPLERARLEQMCVQSQQDLFELQKYFMGKLDIVIEADADLRREQQRSNERMALIADDIRLGKDQTTSLEKRCAMALEESDELRTLLGALREESEHLRSEHNQVRTRVCVLEGSATERWQGFCPGVLYFKSWHRTAKGDDVQFSPDMQVATGRGFLAATGMVTGNTEGLAVADGPCRRFGTPGCYSSYYELEVDEIKMVPEGMGGLWVGFALQSCSEIAAHHSHEFDGWLVGGCGRAMVCRAGTGGASQEIDEHNLPGTFAPGVEGSSVPNVKHAIELLRAALPPRATGEMREFGSHWNSQNLHIGDRIGVLWRSNRDVGARLRVSVNGDIVLTQQFVDAPTAEAVGFFTPVVRLAGSGKAVRLLPGVTPPSKMLAD